MNIANHFREGSNFNTKFNSNSKKMDTKNGWIICRICLQYAGDNMFNIFSKIEGENESLATKIERCFGIKLEENSTLPVKMCKKCYVLLKGAVRFHQLCKLSQDNLKDIKIQQEQENKANKSTSIKLLNHKTRNSSDLQSGKVPNRPSKTLEIESQICQNDNEDSSDGRVEMQRSKNEKEELPLKAKKETTNDDNCVGYSIMITEEDDDGDEDEYNNAKPIIIDEIFTVISEDEDEVIEKVQTDSSQSTAEDTEGSCFVKNEYQIISLKRSKHNSSTTGDFLGIFPKDIHEIKKEFESLEENSVEFLSNNSKKSNQKIKESTRSNNIEPAIKRITKRKPKAQRSSEAKSAAIHICYICGNMYPEKSKLTLHIKTHTQEKPHECEICHKRFAQTPQLMRHINSHTGNRPYKCNYCPSSFADPSTRIKHQRIHTQERPFKCTTCEKSFAYSNVLKVHMMTHTGDKPYACQYCKKKFSQLHHKNTHERIHEKKGLVN